MTPILLMYISTNILNQTFQSKNFQLNQNILKLIISKGLDIRDVWSKKTQEWAIGYKVKCSCIKNKYVEWHNVEI